MVASAAARAPRRPPGRPIAPGARPGARGDPAQSLAYLALPAAEDGGREALDELQRHHLGAQSDGAVIAPLSAPARAARTPAAARVVRPSRVARVAAAAAAPPRAGHGARLDGRGALLPRRPLHPGPARDPGAGGRAGMSAARGVPADARERTLRSRSLPPSRWKTGSTATPRPRGENPRTTARESAPRAAPTPTPRAALSGAPTASSPAASWTAPTPASPSRAAPGPA